MPGILVCNFFADNYPKRKMFLHKIAEYDYDYSGQYLGQHRVYMKIFYK